VSTFSEIAQGIADQFKPSVGERCYGYVPNSINPPTLFVHMTDAKPTTMGSGIFEANFDVFLLVASQSDRVGQDQLTSFASPLDAWTEFGLNNDLDLDDDTRATLQTVRSLSIEELAAYPYYGAVFEVRVTTPGV
jgi:hypothetical protein